MFTKLSVITIAISLMLSFTACTSQPDSTEAGSSTEQLNEDVLTQEAQQALSPEQILDGLKEGNQRFVSNNLTPQDYQAQLSKIHRASIPKQWWSRVSTAVFPLNLLRKIDERTDIFVARVAGNFINEDILGSTEFGTAVAGSKVVVLMGHEHCGAVKSAIDDVKMGNITAMLSKIRPAVELSEEDYEGEGEMTSSNNEYVSHVVNTNVRYTIEQMRERSEIIAELERNGEVVIAGAFFDLDTGEVTFLD